ncbi:hypothetical protein CLV57_2841 [Mucilaginibacter auburnensis]|uniref:Uncharacterized protein n=1 Tax=Mucilaginibacter auburnensis TaxID=1457233 RepID=A0A2H9VMZ6_9SPHI|nr:hypothetical protein CLV57_2841 [Mucilaginibacter auburnensis]
MEKLLSAPILIILVKFIAHVALAIELIGHLVK